MRTGTCFLCSNKTTCSSLCIAWTRWVWSSLVRNTFKWLLVNYYLNFFPLHFNCEYSLDLCKMFNLSKPGEVGRGWRNFFFFLKQGIIFTQGLSMTMNTALGLKHCRATSYQQELTWKSQFSGKEYLGSRALKQTLLQLLCYSCVESCNDGILR